MSPSPHDDHFVLDDDTYIPHELLQFGQEEIQNLLRNVSEYIHHEAPDCEALVKSISVKNEPVKSKRKSKRSASLPKRPLSSYNVFFRVQRQLLLSQDESMSFEDIGKIIGERWRNLKDRSAYDLVSRNDTERYRREMQAFEETRRQRIKTASTKTITMSESTQQLLDFSTPSSDLSVVSRESSIGSVGAQPHKSCFVPLYPTNAPVEPFSIRQQSSMTTGSENLNISVPTQVRPGTVITLQSAHGELKSYTVNYTCFKMSKDDAANFAKKYNATA